MIEPAIFDIGEVSSTNTYLSANADNYNHGDVVFTHCQTSGRGQRGNSWESEPGMNLTFSFMMKGLQVPAPEQFYISEAVSLAIADVLSGYIPNVKIKWPNDIYYNNSKICGILIENTLAGRKIKHSIAGIGININQQKFVSSALNPVSLSQITGDNYNLSELLLQFARKLNEKVSSLTVADYKNYAEGVLMREYIDKLYRYDGKFHKFATPGGGGFNARIVGVASDGKISLACEDATVKQFYFKEVAFVI